MDSYFTPAGAGFGDFTEKRSRFIGYLRPVKTEAEASAFIAEIKKKHYDARHNCSAYVLSEGNITRYSDDGESQGMAGQPILAVINGKELKDVCIVVTRYFGGILLGTGGLVRAYTEGAKLALEAAGIVKMALWTDVLIPCPYNLYERIKRLVDEKSGIIEDTDFGAEVLITAVLPKESVEGFCDSLRELTGGSVSPEICESRFRGV
ncbi:MAG: YigZ family protein [Oscillospiraceae bacterium]|nr:YigZ family protein [Oscillospiraceae bacterium]